MYWVTRIFVGLLLTLAVLAVVAFIFLRTYGVPDPLLREAVRRVNAAGIPVAVDGIILTLGGWRADDVRYYSANPDDLDPVFQARHVYFSMQKSGPGEEPVAWNVDIKAVGVGMTPSVEWGISIPRESPSRQVEEIEVSVQFLPDRIIVSQGKMEWLGARFNVAGTLLKGEREAIESARKQKTFLPRPVTEEQFRSFETWLKRLSLPAGAAVDIGFSIDIADYSSSRVDLAVNAGQVGFDGVVFSKAEIAGSYAYPAIHLERAGLFQGKQSLQLSGEYDLESKEAKGEVYNSITSNHPLLLLPGWMHDQLSEVGLRIGQLPRLEINFGPAAVKELLNHLSGNFAIHDVAYQGIEVEVLRGQVKRENNRLELSNLQGLALGQEDRAEEGGSAMHGGPADGSVFWDENTREFGVEANINFDPNLIVQALSPVRIATNIIRRFSFKDRPPQGHVSLGANVDDWGTFYIDIQGTADDVVFQGVEFSSINATETYRHGKLNLDPVAGMQGAAFIKGSALLDFRESTVAFDAVSSMDPADLEDIIFSRLNLFGNHIRAEGDIRITAQGVFDWDSMQQTDFLAKVEAERVDIPVAILDRFVAEVVGNGPVIAVKNATFGLYGGEGKGDLSLAWNPPGKELPYTTDVVFSNVDFCPCMAFLCGDKPISVSGKLTGNAHVEADFSTNFFATANGAGSVRVDDGQLADLPLFKGFSRLMRKIFPSFTVFSITSLRGNFSIVDGVVSTEDAYFEGDVLSAKGHGSYAEPAGFDVCIQAQMLSEGKISTVVRAITDPLMKLFEMRLTGTLADPAWELDNF
ncbi:MAG: AsmA-like C-terminal region-containing protein [Verrucomicrobiota bacterium]